MPPRYAVTRANWRRLPGGVFRLPGRADVATFDTLDAADADRAAREARFRARVNPVTWGDALYDTSRLPIHPLTDFLLETSLEPPGPGVNRRGWAAWWAATYRTLSPVMADAAWRAFDLLSPCYAVEERPAADLYAPLILHWAARSDEEYAEDDMQYSGVMRAASEGGRLSLLYRVEPDVSAGGWGGREWNEYREYDVGGYYAFETDPVKPPSGPQVISFGDRGDGIPTADVAAVPWHGPTGIPTRAAVVIRLGWWPVGEGRQRRWHGFADSRYEAPIGLPVAAFPDRESAEADAWARDIEARRYLNPFRFGPPPALSSVGEIGFRAVLADFGLDLPAVHWDDHFETQAAWVRWWELTAGRLSVGQRETAWDLFDRLRFHAVAELPVRG